MAKLERCLVGGTFDRFHQGHKSLLNAALDSAELVEVWITNDAMSAAKSPVLQSFEFVKSPATKRWGTKGGELIVNNPPTVKAPETNTTVFETE